MKNTLRTNLTWHRGEVGWLNGSLNAWSDRTRPGTESRYRYAIKPHVMPSGRSYGYDLFLSLPEIGRRESLGWHEYQRSAKVWAESHDYDAQRTSRWNNE